MILRILNYVNKYQKKKLVSWPTSFLIYPTTASAISSRLIPAK